MLLLMWKKPTMQLPSIAEGINAFFNALSPISRTIRSFNYYYEPTPQLQNRYYYGSKLLVAGLLEQYVYQRRGGEPRNVFEQVRNGDANGRDGRRESHHTSVDLPRRT